MSISPVTSTTKSIVETPNQDKKPPSYRDVLCRNLPGVVTTEPTRNEDALKSAVYTNLLLDRPFFNEFSYCPDDPIPKSPSWITTIHLTTQVCFDYLCPTRSKEE